LALNPAACLQSPSQRTVPFNQPPKATTLAAHAAHLAQVDVGDVRHLERRDLLGLREDLVRDLLGRGLPRLVVELDAKVVVGAAGVVAGAHDEAPVELVAADDGAHRRGGHDRVAPHHHLAEPVARGQLDDDLGGLLAKVAPVTAQAQGLARHLVAQRVEQGLHPVGQVVGLSRGGGGGCERAG